MATYFIEHLSINSYILELVIIHYDDYLITIVSDFSIVSDYVLINIDDSTKKQYI